MVSRQVAQLTPQRPQVLLLGPNPPGPWAQLAPLSEARPPSPLREGVGSAAWVT